MHTNSITTVNNGGSGGSHGDGLSLPADERLRELCQGLLWILGRETQQDPVVPTSPNRQLQAEAGRILRPHLEAGLRELTEVLRDDLLVRIAYVQQLERFTALEDEASSLSRLLLRQSQPFTAPVVSEAAPSPPILTTEKEPPSPPPGPTEYSFDWQSATLEEEQALSSEPAPPASTPATTTPDAATLPATSLLPSSQPALLEADLRQAVELWRQGDEDRALTLCSRTLQHNPAAAPAYLLRGQMYEQSRQFAHALADFTSAIALCPQHPRAYLRRGLIHLRQKAWPEAIADAKAVIRLQPDCGSAYFLHASASFQQGDPQTALADLNHLLQREPNNVPAYNERGLVLASLGEYPRALADYTRASRLKPRFVPARYNRALALLQQGHLDLALAAFTELIQLAPDNALAYYQRARIHQTRQEHESAVADCKHCLKLQPQFPEAQACLRELQKDAVSRSERPSPPTRELAADTTEKKAVEAAQRKPAVDGKPAKAPSVSKKDAEDSSRESANAQCGSITLTCEQCGASCQIGVDRLDRKFQCRKCRRIYSVRPDGRLTEFVRPRSPREQFKVSLWKGVRLSPLAALLLLLILAAWYGWRGIASARTLPALPNELEPRAEILVKAWLSRDAGRIQRLTTPSQEDRIDAWLRANPVPVPAEELKASRTWIHQTKIETHVQTEERDRVQLRIQVNTPVSAPINLVQQWVKIGAAWYFQPFPEKRKGW